jgi:hypothetical protein
MSAVNSGSLRSVTPHRVHDDPQLAVAAQAFFFALRLASHWAEEEIRLDKLPPKSGSILEAILYRGELPRGEAAAVVGVGDRQARRIVSALIEKGVLTSESQRSPVRLTFRAALASRWMPGQFPERIP